MKYLMGFLVFILPIFNFAYAQCDCDCDYKYREKNSCQGRYATNRVAAPSSAAKHDYVVRFTSNAPKGQCSIVRYTETMVVGTNKFDNPSSITVNGWRDSETYSGLMYFKPPIISIQGCDVCVGKKNESNNMVTVLTVR